ncbi:sulfotransferase [Methylophaga thiooxydans]|uniref:sulfotransferase n=1 Tax=Methylophaga thiooxydans TaxID=392484 RepID=UPI002355711F|nr:sulfotransferase [Methylophaga thiooxydans]
MNDEKRTASFQRNTELESLLGQLNNTLSQVESATEKNYQTKPAFPLIFVMGAHRCGSTLFMQWLAQTGLFAYPTNLLSRFYKAPLVGAQIQLLLTDPRFNFRNEILDFTSEVDFRSENGKTQGALAPNEFWYFWRRFLPFDEIEWLSDSKLHELVDKAALTSELRGLTRVLAKPFALKSMILNYNIPFLSSVFPEAIFVQIKRDPVANVASMLEARKRQLGSEKEWYSFKIPEYEILKDMEPVQQVAGQYYFINKAIRQGISQVSGDRKLIINYEHFCEHPRLFLEKLSNLTGIDWQAADVKHNGFDVTRAGYENPVIENAIKSFEEIYG